VLTPLQLVERLVALIPPPGVHMIRYHGAFAPNARVRSQLVPTSATAADAALDQPPRCTHAGRQSYAFLMKRVFAREDEVCGRCGGRTTIEFVTAKDEIEQLLRSIGYPNAPGGDEVSAA
jgi:hypothetical protein